MQSNKFWIYKCNDRNGPHQFVWGDWNEFFSEQGEEGLPREWGNTKDVPALSDARPEHIIMAYQTDRNELVGLAQVVEFRSAKNGGKDLLLKSVRKIGVKIRPSKSAIQKLQPFQHSSQDQSKLFMKSLQKTSIACSEPSITNRQQTNMNLSAGFRISESEKLSKPVGKVKPATLNRIVKVYAHDPSSHRMDSPKHQRKM